MQEKLRLHCAPVQLPIGLEDQHAGLIDLIKMKAFHFKGPNGEEITEVPSAPSHPDAAAHLTNTCPSPLATSCTCSSTFSHKKECVAVL